MTIWLPCIATGTGAEVWTRRLAAGLEARGWQVQLDLIPHRYQYAPWAAPVRPPATCELTIANSWSAAAFAGAAPLMTVVHHVVHDPALAPHRTVAQAVFHRAFVKPMERAAMRRSARIVAVSDTTRRAIAHAFGRRDAVTVLNGVDTAFFVPGDRATQGEKPLELLFVGKPSRRKGFDFVARLASELGPRARLRVIGPPGEMGLACPEAEWLGRVPREELRRAYQQADFVLLPSRVEGFGYAAAESMACGTPVLCAPTGAVSEIAGTAGVVAALDDPAATARTLLDASGNAAAYAAMRSAARRIATQTLSEGRWLDEMEQLVAQCARPPLATRKVSRWIGR